MRTEVQVALCALAGAAVGVLLVLAAAAMAGEPRLYIWLVHDMTRLVGPAIAGAVPGGVFGLLRASR